MSTTIVSTNHTKIKILALSMYDDENSIIRMLRNGIKGYILKDSESEELQTAIEALINKDYYHSDLISGKLINTINYLDDGEMVLKK